MRTIINSLQNSRLKKIIQLRERKNRQSTGLTIVEGFREVSGLQEAQEIGALLKELFVCREFLKNVGKEDLVKAIEAQGISVFEVSPEVYAKISFGDRREGLLAVCQPPFLKLEDLKLRKIPMIVVVEGIEKPGNWGAILRTCDGAGVDALLVCGGQTDIYNPNVIRSSLGAVFCVRVVQCTQQDALKFLQDRNIQVCATTPQAKMFYGQVDFKVPVAIVLGSEEKGLSDFWLNHADEKIKIPMHGNADSLNVSATAAVVIYEGLRQRVGYVS